MEFVLGLILTVQCLEEKGSQIKWYQKGNLNLKYYISICGILINMITSQLGCWTF